MTSGNGGDSLAVPVALLSVVALAIAFLSLVFSLLAFTGGQPKSAPAPAHPSNVADPNAFTQEFVQQAIDYYDSHGRADTVAFYNTTESVNGHWYAFILDENEIMISHPLRKDRIGTGRDARVDSTGYAYGPEMAAATEAGVWVSYHFENPQTAMDTLKHTWVVRHDELYFGSGWWE